MLVREAFYHTPPPLHGGLYDCSLRMGTLDKLKWHLKRVPLGDCVEQWYMAGTWRLASDFRGP